MIREPSTPSTRLSAIAFAPGWLKVTFCPAPMLKLCQLIASLSLAWLMTSWLPPGAPIWPLPDTMLPPVGSDCAISPWLLMDTSRPSASGVSRGPAGRRRVAPLVAPGEAPSSEATWTWPRARLNTRR